MSDETPRSRKTYEIETEETRVYKTTYEVEATSEEEARRFLYSRERKEILDEFLETLDVTVTSISEIGPEESDTR